jgi:nucleotide-binding universal stress UspA family protein
MGLLLKKLQLPHSKFRPGLIVIGTRGIGNQTGGFFGSVTAKLIEKTNTPVLAIPEQSKFSGIGKVKNVLYATDFDQSDHLAISKLINLLHPFNVSLHCIHISVGVKKSWDKVKMDGLSAFIDREYKKFPVKCEIIISDDIINGLETYIRNNDIDVIAVTNHNRGLLSSFFTTSITKKVLTRITKPLFVFKSED